MNADTRARLVQAATMDKLARAGVLEIGEPPTVPEPAPPPFIGGAELAEKFATGEIDKEAFLGALGGSVARGLGNLGRAARTSVPVATKGVKAYQPNAISKGLSDAAAWAGKNEKLVGGLTAGGGVLTAGALGRASKPNSQ